MNLEGKTALITGGAVRLGKAITLALAQAGANVVINYNRSSEAAMGTVTQAEAFGVQAMSIRADVANLGDVEAMVSAARDVLGPISVLVNSASLWRKTPFPTDNIADWHRVTGILVHGAFYCANAVTPMMLTNREGVIINIVDLSAWGPWPNFMAHSVGKAGLLALTRQLAVDLAPAVRVNAIAPGPVMPPPGDDPETIAHKAGKTLLNRWGTPDDIAEAVLFLVRANYITGEVLAVDGGERLGHYKFERR
jgi:NAD(P)-dependent dehydrogenase (short-subunit alcohol dehydrogenase family)